MLAFFLHLPLPESLRQTGKQDPNIHIVQIQAASLTKLCKSGWITQFNLNIMTHSALLTLLQSAVQNCSQGFSSLVHVCIRLQRNSKVEKVPTVDPPTYVNSVQQNGNTVYS